MGHGDAAWPPHPATPPGPDGWHEATVETLITSHNSVAITDNGRAEVGAKRDHRCAGHCGGPACVQQLHVSSAIARAPTRKRLPNCELFYNPLCHPSPPPYGRRSVYRTSHHAPNMLLGAAWVSHACCSPPPKKRFAWIIPVPAILVTIHQGFGTSSTLDSMTSTQPGHRTDRCTCHFVALPTSATALQRVHFPEPLPGHRGGAIVAGGQGSSPPCPGRSLTAMPSRMSDCFPRYIYQIHCPPHFAPL